MNRRQTQKPALESVVLLLLTAVFLIVACLPMNAAAETGGTPKDLDAYIQNEFKKTHFPGMTVQIVDLESVQFTKGYGSSTDLDAGFIIGSLSKCFTAVGILQLREQGLLELSDPVSRYLPELDGSGATVLQLLNHTSGIREFNTLEDFQTSDTAAPFEYANVNYGLLGKIIETVSGMAYADYLEAYIFKPLGMRHSYASLEQVEGNMEPGHRNYFGLMAQEAYTYPDSSIRGWLTVPAGYLIAGTNDMGRYMQMLLRGGDGILQKSSAEEMMTGTVDVQEGYQYGLGLGITRNTAGEPLVLHGGNVENYTTYMILMPERGIGLIVMYNACDYFVANEMAVTLAMNILNRYIGADTVDIEKQAYLFSHVLMDAAMLLVLILSLLPLLLIKRWRMKNAAGIRKAGGIRFCLFHIAVPTLMLLTLPLLGLPLDVVRGFAPDIFIMILACSVILYLTGLIKVIVRVRVRGLLRPGQS